MGELYKRHRERFAGDELLVPVGRDRRRPARPGKRLRKEDPERAVWREGTCFVLRRWADSLSEGERAVMDELAQTNERVYRGWLLLNQLRAVYQAADPRLAPCVAESE